MASLESLVPILGSLYWATLLSYYFAKFAQAPGGIPPSLLGFAPFVIVFLVGALGVWRKPKAGYATTAAISGVSLILVGPNLGIGEALSPEGFLTGGATANGILIVTLLFSLLGARGTWKKAAPTAGRPFKPGRRAGIGALALIFLFIAVGVVYAGANPTGTSNTGQADIVIAPGAAYITSNQFYLPSTFNAKVGQTVVWKNLDLNPHTITSDNGLFQSGNMDRNAAFSFTFTKAGTYSYSCDYHPWMTGRIVVSSG